MLYNTCLDDCVASYGRDKKFVFGFDLVTKHIPIFRKTDNRFSNCNYSSLQQTVRRFEKSLKRFLKLKKDGCGFPRRKVFERFNTIEYVFGDGIGIKGDKLRVQGLGQIKVFWSQEIPSQPKYATLSKRGGQYYVTFFVEFFSGTPPAQGDKSVGFDFGLKTFLVGSDGTRIENPKFHKQDLKDLAKAHRKIHRTAKKTQQRERKKKVLGKIHSRIFNRRKDFNHQLSRRLVNNFDIICVENLSMKDLLVRKGEMHGQAAKNINRSYADVAFGQFRQFLSYKAENAGKKVVFVNPAYTTQTCSACGTLVVKGLDDRAHICVCGHAEDRDVNAAKNILRLGLQSLRGASAPK